MRELRPFFLRVFGLSLLAYLVTAYFSVGFFSWDEHYQTLEFLSPRLGRGGVADLPWEYVHAVRPWFQPGLYYLVIQGLRAIGIENAAQWALMLRGLSGILSWSSMAFLTVVALRSSERWFESSSSRKRAIALAGLLCFLPFLGVRTSSENISASVFFLGLSAYFLIEGRWKGVVSGLLMGAAIQFRYQDAFMVLGFLGYLIYRRDRRSAVSMLATVLLVSGLGVCVDAWGYGVWTFVPWNYLRENLLEGRANAFSQDPPWFYFTRYSELMPPIGALGFITVIGGWVRRPLHVLSWVTLPFFVVHTALSHKEVRFLFPILPAAPFLMVMGLEWVSEAKFRRAWRGLRWILLPANFLLLVIFGLKPAYSPFLLYQFVGGHPEIRQIYYRDEDPFVQIRSLQTTFFRPPGTQSVKSGGFEQLESKLLEQGVLWLFEGAPTLPQEAGRMREECRREFSAFPEWLNAFNFIPGIRYANRRSLFLCRAPL